MEQIESRLLEVAQIDVEEVGDGCMEGHGQFDWQACLPLSIREMWKQLPLSARLVAFVCAEEIADTIDPSDD